jgi:AraC family transcriptional regulator of adaptative response/methylated-DNA-[protein]-cysteine methyltransferase
MYGAGFGSSSRLYEAAAAELGMTPARWKSGGAGERIGFAVRPSPLGLLLVAATERGIAFLGLGEHEQRLERELREELPKAVLVRDDGGLGGFVEPVLKHLAGKLPHVDLPLDVRATAFQRRVWQELRKIPLGTTTTYKRIAEALGRPTAARAVARAVATNPVSVLIPCHRVIRGDGNLGGYRWGLERKERLLDREKREAAT